ncbi:hypothetical protein QM012_009385 [Aureobasidium pullulans]|uniref:Uncharacterized protein n=1 Tax=Aureobasidium pullulans TaxID=5580 RepID=A0ABR0TGQ8_AURPU
MECEDEKRGPPGKVRLVNAFGDSDSQSFEDNPAGSSEPTAEGVENQEVAETEACVLVVGRAEKPLRKRLSDPHGQDSAFSCRTLNNLLIERGCN